MEDSRLASFHADGVTWSDERLWPQFAALAEANPDAIALIDCDDRRWTRGELRALALNHGNSARQKMPSIHLILQARRA